MGVEPLLPGFEKIRIAPQPGDIMEAKCKVPTIKGPVFVHFNQEPDTFSLDFEIPANTTVKVVLPQFDSKNKVLLDNKTIEVKHDNGEYYIETGSGQHSLIVKQ